MDDISVFEAAGEPLTAERRARAGIAVSVRLSPDVAERLMTIAERRGISLSAVAREVLTAYVAAPAE